MYLVLRLMAHDPEPDFSVCKDPEAAKAEWEARKKAFWVAATTPIVRIPAEKTADNVLMTEAELLAKIEQLKKDMKNG